MRYRIRPVTLADARRFVAEHHSHNGPPRGHIVSLGIETHPGGELVGVAIGGRPVARALDDGGTAEIVRVCIRDGEWDNACSMAYGSMRRALVALGHRRIFTYTLACEKAACVRAAGFRKDADLPERKAWDTPSRPRVQTDLFGVERRPTGPKVRWVWP